MSAAVAQIVALRYRVAHRYLEAQRQKQSRQIYAALPFEVRLAHTIFEILKVAYTSDNSLTLGLALLHAYYKVGLKGPIGHTGLLLEDTGNILNSSKAFKPAMALANMVFKGVKIRNPDHLEDAVFLVIQELQEGKHHLDPKYSIAQANKYISQRINYRVLDLLRHEKVEEKNREVAYDLMDPGSLKSKVPTKIWHAFLKEIDRNPIFKDSNGKNRMMDWIQFELGASEYDTKEALAASMGLTERAFTKTWLQNPRRQQALQKAFDIVLGYM